MSSYNKNKQTSGLSKRNRNSQDKYAFQLTFTQTDSFLFVLRGMKVYPINQGIDHYTVVNYKGYKLFYQGLLNKKAVKKSWAALVKVNIFRFERVELQFFTATKDFINIIKNLLHVGQNVKVHSTELAIRFGKAALMFVNMTSEKVTISKLIERLIDVYIVFADIKDMLIPQSGGTFLFSAMISFLPKELQNILFRMNSLASEKFLDDISLWHKIVMEVINYIELLIRILVPEKFREKLLGFKNYFSYHTLLEDIKRMCIKYKDVTLFSNKNNLEEIQILRHKVFSNEILMEWARSSVAVNNRIKAIDSLYKMSHTFAQASRIEPICMGFEGPAGCGKSTLMAKMAKIMQHPVYNHVVPTADKGDWYDQYPEVTSEFFQLNEDGSRKEHIMMLDDVGQNGPSQYSPFMNLISTIKMPLPCAEAAKKDTRYFLSTGILFTTNRVKDLQFVRTDGISTPSALYRRIFLFDFVGAGSYGSGVGKIVCKHYDLERDIWKIGPHPDVSQWMESRKFELSNEISLDKEEFQILTWLAKWYTVSRRTKENNYRSTVGELPDIAKVLEDIPQNLADTIYNKFWHLEGDISFYEYCQFYMSYLTGLFTDNKIAVSFVLMIGIILYAVFRFVKTEKEAIELQSNIMIINDSQNGSSQANKVKSQTCYIQFSDDEIATCVISGHFIITVGHVTNKDRDFITVYKDLERNVRYLDKALAIREYYNTDDDVAVWKINSAQLTPFSKLKNYTIEKTNMDSAWLITPYATVSLKGNYVINNKISTYVLHNKQHEHAAGTTVKYKYESAGMCGSPIWDDKCGLMGHHIAKGDGQGVAKIFSNKTRRDIYNMINSDFYVVDEHLEIKEIGEDTSGVKIKLGVNAHTPKVNSVVPGPLYGTFGDPEKEPVDLMWDGHGTVKTLLKESLKPVNKINYEDLEFAYEAMSTKFRDFSPLSDAEVIKGTKILAGIDMSTSSGLFSADKKELIDKDGGTLTEKGEHEIREFTEQLTAEVVDLKQLLAQETLKAETRSISKNKKPRSFRVLRFPLNFLLKKFCGGMVENFVEDMWSTHMCIGFNPYQHFGRLYDELKDMNVIASDVGSWDKAMLPQVQYAMIQLILDHFKGSTTDRFLLRKCLYLCLVTPVQANDDTFITTHSMPSGCYLTAMGNSIVHQIYTLMCYHSLYPEDSVTQALSNIKDFVMGDDKLCGVVKHREKFNNFSLKEYFSKLGLKLSSYDKTEIKEAYDPIEKVEFLKRKFSYHPKLHKMVGVLSDQTLLSSINFIDFKKDINETIKGKIAAFQIENFLKYDTYNERVKILRTRCEALGIDFKYIPPLQLVYLFETNQIEYDFSSVGHILQKQ